MQKIDFEDWGRGRDRKTHALINGLGSGGGRLFGGFGGMGLEKGRWRWEKKMEDDVGGGGWGGKDEFITYELHPER